MPMLPERFREEICRQLGTAEGEALCEALLGESPTAIRCHPLKGRDVVTDEAIPWSRWGGYLGERPSFTLDPAFHAGAYYVQEASSQFVGKLLERESLEGGRLLDLCAAPGGKSTLYASIVGEQGLVVANEVDRKRVQILADNVRKWGMGNVVVTTADAARMRSLHEWFDVVAVDAPCSGEGMFRRLPESREEWSPEGVMRCAAIQRTILEEVWPALRPGGLLIYSTCTFNRHEDEEVLEDFMARHAADLESVEPVEEARAWGICTGRVGAFHTYRFFPHRAKGEGFFVAVVRKSGCGWAVSLGRGGKSTRSVVQPVEKREVAELERWLLRPEEHHFYRAGEMLYACAKSRFQEVERLSERVSVVYAGVALGAIFKGRLKPDGALAFYMGLNREALPVTELDDEEVLVFLRKGELKAESFSQGLNLVCCRELALGFAKRIGTRVNNMYPNSLRIMNK